MNAPISSDVPVRHAPARARRIALGFDGATGRRKAPYRPAHAAHARPAVAGHDDDPVVDLTGAGEDLVVARAPKLFDDAAADQPRPARPTPTPGGTRAAARARRAQPTGQAGTPVPTPTRPAGPEPRARSGTGAGAGSGAAMAGTQPDRDPLGFIRSVDAAWTAASCWVRRTTTVQLVLPCLALMIAGLAALVATGGATQRLGQVVLTASLVTAGVAWAQALGDQRRRQQDLRFRLASGNLERADLTGTVLDGFTLWGQNLRGAKLSGCSADHVLLSGADLRDASMSGASLRVASLAGADLSAAHLYRSDLRGADLTGAIARGASFEFAVLRGALLDGADLSGADLSGADLRGALHDERTNWAGIVVSDDTRLPEDLPARNA